MDRLDRDRRSRGPRGSGTAGRRRLDLGQFAILFPMVILFALWAVLAAVWPQPATRPVTA
ncbi:MAG: hypothetical protein ACREK5_08685 [Gemmatimonadota bacterium]